MNNSLNLVTSEQAYGYADECLRGNFTHFEALQNYILARIRWSRYKDPTGALTVDDFRAMAAALLFEVLRTHKFQIGPKFFGLTYFFINNTLYTSINEPKQIFRNQVGIESLEYALESLTPYRAWTDSDIESVRTQLIKSVRRRLKALKVQAPSTGRLAHMLFEHKLQFPEVKQKIWARLFNTTDSAISVAIKAIRSVIDSAYDEIFVVG